MERTESSSKGAVGACLGSLPDDILKIIFGKCNCSTILSLSRVNRRFYLLSKTEECARIKCREIIPFMHIICLLPKCAFQDISKFQPSSEEDWKESYKYGVSTKGWKETLQIYKELAHIRDFPQITGKNRKKWIKNTLSIMIRSILQFMAEILLVLGLLSFLRNSEIAYRVRANGEAAKKSFTDTLTFSTLLIGSFCLIDYFIYLLNKHCLSKLLYVIHGFVLSNALYFDYFWKHVPIFLFIWPYFALSALIFAWLLMSEFQRAFSFSKYIFLLLDSISAVLMLMFFVTASLKADAHIYRVLVYIASLKWREIYFLLTLSVLILFTRFLTMLFSDRMFGEILTHADNITISIFMVCACVVLLPFLILVPLKLDGSIKLHFGFCIASVIAPLIIADFLWVPQLSVSDSLKLERGWEWEERRSGYSFAIQKFEWLRMKLGLTKFAENETVVGFAEFTETDEREPGRGIWPTGRPKKSSWKDYDAIEKALKMRKDFYAKFEALERNWWTCFAKKEETFAVNLTRLLESNISKVFIVSVVVVIYLIL